MINEFFKNLSDDEKKEAIKNDGWGKYSIDDAYKKGPEVFLSFSLKMI